MRNAYKLKLENLNDRRPLEDVGLEERTTILSLILNVIIFKNSVATLQYT